jgi:hypothetical protein
MRTFRFVVLILVATAFTFPAKDVKLEYTFKVGDQYDFGQTFKQTIKQNIAGTGDITVDVNIDARMELKVAEITSTGARIELAYKKLKVETKSPMMNMTVDSESAEDNTQNKVMKIMMNKNISFVLTKRGMIEKVEGIENLYSGLPTLGLDDATQAQLKQYMSQTLGEKSIKSNLEMGFIQYPENKVKESDTWRNSVELVSNFIGKIENSWLLKKVEGDQASIESDGSITTIDKDKITTLPNGIKTKSDLAGRQVLAGKVNVKSGWPTEVKILSEVKGQMKYLAGGMIPEDMDVPMEQTIEGTYTIVKK